MRLPKFAIQNTRNIRLAACSDVPTVMIVTGPNGCGKSTLLYNLKRSSGMQGMLYVGPHRTSRRSTVQMRYLAQPRLSMRQIHTQDDLPGFDGIPVYNHTRDAWDFDEASSYLKYAMCQIELDILAALGDRWHRDGEVPAGAIPDVWKPMRDMVSNLLPHLTFSRIDVSNRNHIRCLWNTHSADIEIDLDDLSSGEKAVVRLFFPLIENRIQRRIERARGSNPSQENEEICVLVDEPELHLHPSLQAKVLDYVRVLAARDNVQFVLATHSPTIVEYAMSDELFLLRPSEFLGQDDNQLVRIASDDDRLAMIREVFGSTSHLTALKPILVVEGEQTNAASRSASDERIYSFLNERFSQVTLLPAGGKADCRRLVTRLNELLVQWSPALRAFALLDSDVETGTEEDGVITLPVSMIENFLIDPDCIWDAVSTVHHKIPLDNRDDVETALDRILDELHDAEAARRVKAVVGVYRFRLRDPVESATKQTLDFSQRLGTELSAERIERLIVDANKQIAMLAERKQRREFFHGKKVLNRFYSAHLKASGMSKEIFLYSCAQTAAKRASVSAFVDHLFAALLPHQSIPREP